LQYLANFIDLSCPTHAPRPLPREIFYQLTATKQPLVLANIADSKRHDPDNSYIVQGFTLDRFTIFGNQRPSSQRGKLRPAARQDKNLIPNYLV
jgi:hypothetical protein